MRKKMPIILSIFILCLIIVCIFLFNNKDYFSESELKELLIRQAEIDKLIKREISNKENTIDNPKILINPYEISPLTALIIFKTNNESKYELFINGDSVGVTEEVKEHIIPIYGLISNYDNEIVLKSDKEYKYIVKTDKVNVGKMDIIKSSKQLDTNMYFMVGGQNPTNVAYDKEGNVRWYLTEDLAIDMDFLENGHILIGNGNGSSYVGFTGVLEIDFLGKIYNEYLLSGGAHHTLLKMPSGNYLISTGTSSEEISWDYLVEIDPKTGENVKEINLVELFKDIDSEFVEGIEEESTFAYNNSAYYDEKTNTLTLSLRRLNSIINIDYHTLKLNWIYGDKSNWTDKFDEYFLNKADNSRNSYGQHSVFYFDDKFGLFDNHVLDIYDEKCSVLLNTYSSADIFEISGNNYKNIFTFNSNKKYFSPYLSSFSVLPNGNMLVNYGYVLDKTEFKKVNCELDLYVKSPIVMLYELDSKGNVLLEASFDGQAKQFVYKNNFYKGIIRNFGISNYKLYKNY